MYALNGELFKANCASCHKPDAVDRSATEGRPPKWKAKGDIHAWVKNSQGYLKTGNPRPPPFGRSTSPPSRTANAVSDADIDAILYYADNFKPPVAAPTPGVTATAPEPGKHTAWQWAADRCCCCSWWCCRWAA